MSQKTLQQIFDLAMPYYEKKHFMCISLEWACRDTYITQEERDVAIREIESYLNEHVFLFDLIYERFACDKKDLLLSDLQQMCSAVFVDWENRDQIIQSFKQQFWEIKNES